MTKAEILTQRRKDAKKRNLTIVAIRHPSFLFVLASLREINDVKQGGAPMGSAVELVFLQTVPQRARGQTQQFRRPFLGML